MTECQSNYSVVGARPVTSPTWEAAVRSPCIHAWLVLKMQARRRSQTFTYLIFRNDFANTDCNWTYILDPGAAKYSCMSLCDIRDPMAQYYHRSSEMIYKSFELRTHHINGYLTNLKYILDFWIHVDVKRALGFGLKELDCQSSTGIQEMKIAAHKVQQKWR